MAKKDYTVKIQSTCPVSLSFSDGDVGRYDKKLKELSDQYDLLSRLPKRCSGYAHEAEYVLKNMRHLSRVVIKYGQTPRLISEMVFGMLIQKLKKVGYEHHRAIPIFRDAGEKFNESYLIQLAIYFEQIAVHIDHDVRNTRLDFMDIHKRAWEVVGQGHIGQHARVLYDEEFHRQALEGTTMRKIESIETYYRTISNNLINLANQLLIRHIDLKQQMAGKIQA
jgi:hypothetical protein